MKAIIYARVSTRDQEVQNQLQELEAYAGNMQWTVTDIIVDETSGSLSLKEREGFRTVFDLARRRKVAVVLFWALDRFSREGAAKTLGYLQQLSDYGVGWHSYTEPYLSTFGPFSDAIVALLAAIAKQERIRIRERTKAGLERARKQGKHIGRPKVSAHRIAQAQRLRATGASYAQIARAMGVSRTSAHRLCQSA